MTSNKRYSIDNADGDPQRGERPSRRPLAQAALSTGQPMWHPMGVALKWRRWLEDERYGSVAHGAQAEAAGVSLVDETMTEYMTASCEASKLRVKE